jgi:hypothetical protein
MDALIIILFVAATDTLSKEKIRFPAREGGEGGTGTNGRNHDTFTYLAASTNVGKESLAS